MKEKPPKENEKSFFLASLKITKTFFIDYVFIDIFPFIYNFSYIFYKFSYIISNFYFKTFSIIKLESIHFYYICLRFKPVCRCLHVTVFCRWLIAKMMSSLLFYLLNHPIFTRFLFFFVTVSFFISLLISLSLSPSLIAVFLSFILFPFSVFPATAYFFYKIQAFTTDF